MEFFVFGDFFFFGFRLVQRNGHDADNANDVEIALYQRVLALALIA